MTLEIFDNTKDDAPRTSGHDIPNDTVFKGKIGNIESVFLKFGFGGCENIVDMNDTKKCWINRRRFTPGNGLPIVVDYQPVEATMIINKAE